MILGSSLVINLTVYIAVWIDDFICYGLFVFLIDTYFLQRSSRAVIIFLIVQLVAAQLHADNVASFQIDNRFSF